jgi:mannose-1-phosphate guanylyltransferase/mannose-6-phosphate isomerase
MISAYAVLLAGGTGTRLWPVSREHFPKQLVNFIGEDSLVQSTIKRLTPPLDPERVRIVCGEEHVNEIKRHITEIGMPAERKIIPEPCGRNTAPAILLAVFHILALERDAVVGIFPADHVIRDIDAFHEKITAAFKLAYQGYIVTFGIKPDYPETGYGYIEGAEIISEDARIIRSFIEKPDKETAQKYLAAGNYFWNSGMFAFKASVMRDEYRKLAPDLYREMEQMVANDGAVTSSGYRALPDISIDYAIMEQTGKGVLLPSDFGWSDIGSWKSLYDFLPKDDRNNVISGDVILKDTECCFILGSERLIAANRLRNAVVVDTPDSVFVSDLDNSRDVKQIVSMLKTTGREEFKTHRTIHYPWGTVTILEKQAESKVERLMMYPGKTFQCSADEQVIKHLTVVSGEGRICAKGGKNAFRKGESFQIPEQGTVKIENFGQEPLVIIQVVIGIKNK